MKISVIGCGYLGTVHAAALAKLGHDVVGIDVDAKKVESLTRGEAPFFEPGLVDILHDGVASGHLTFSTDMAAVEGCTLHFLAVGTPQRAGANGADLRFVNEAIDTLLPYLGPHDVVAGKSTVPVGTAARLARRLKKADSTATLVWNPEFLREGFAVMDTVEPDRLVYGLPRDETAEHAASVLNEVYAHALANGTPLVSTDYATAELVKVAANAFLATKISFINAMAEIADVTGADVTQLADAIGYDDRIGRKFLNAGAGFGGGCLPKDIRAFRARAEELGVGDSVSFLRNVDEINLRQRKRVVDIAVDELGGVAGKRIAVLGLAFKPESDDIRDSPALDVAVTLNGLGAIVLATDPQAIANSRVRHPQLTFVDDAMEAVDGADAVILVTEWKQYRELDPVEVSRVVRNPVIIDGRNVLDPIAWRAAGWTYRGMGRP